jgi:uncharacterized protein with FMN-binding domain
MKKFLLSFSLIFVFTAYVLYQRQGGSLTETTIKLPVSSQPIITKDPVPNTPVVRGLYKDGIYKGSSEYAYTDYIQVNAVIKDGKLIDVQFPASANGPSRSRQIYAYSMPRLKSEAISAQSANVDSISGASYNSQAFQQSLEYALNKAKN